jgi:hypothetical protein
MTYRVSSESTAASYPAGRSEIGGRYSRLKSGRVLQLRESCQYLHFCTGECASICTSVPVGQPAERPVYIIELTVKFNRCRSIPVDSERGEY